MWVKAAKNVGVSKNRSKWQQTHVCFKRPHSTIAAGNEEHELTQGTISLSDPTKRVQEIEAAADSKKKRSEEKKLVGHLPSKASKNSDNTSPCARAPETTSGWASARNSFATVVGSSVSLLCPPSSPCPNSRESKASSMARARRALTSPRTARRASATRTVPVPRRSKCRNAWFISLACINEEKRANNQAKRSLWDLSALFGEEEVCHVCTIHARHQRV